MKVIEKNFYCDKCMVEFSIRVEPAMNKEEVMRNAPESINWLNGEEMTCPCCNGPLEER